MQIQRNARQIRIVFHRSFRRPVKILANVEAPHSASLIPHPFPAGALFPASQRTVRRRRNQARFIRIATLPQMDWRILGDHDPEIAGNREEVAW